MLLLRKGASVHDLKLSKKEIKRKFYETTRKMVTSKFTASAKKSIFIKDIAAAETKSNYFEVIKTVTVATL